MDHMVSYWPEEVSILELTLDLKVNFLKGPFTDLVCKLNG